MGKRDRRISDSRYQEAFPGINSTDGMKREKTEPIVLESNQNHATITNNGICPTLPSSMGLGGGYVPMILVKDDDCAAKEIQQSERNGNGRLLIITTEEKCGNVT